jgi:hypothetical protein
MQMIRKLVRKNGFVENSISMKCHTLFQFKNVQHFKNDVRKYSIQLLISINSSIFYVSLLSSQFTEHDEQKTRMMLIVIPDGQLLKTEDYVLKLCLQISPCSSSPITFFW